MTAKLNILIVGGGIAGCCAAIALSGRGHRVRIVEKQPEWRFQSSGIFVYANGLMSLDALGLLDAVLAAGFTVPEGRNVYYDHTGAEIVTTRYPKGEAGRIPAILGIKRAELHRVMSTRVRSLDVPLQLGTTIESLSEDAQGVTVTLSHGESLRCDLVIGADGVRSATRAMIGIDAAPRYTGFGIWRSVHPRPPGLRDKIMMMGPGKRFGIMPISEDRIYTFGTVAEPADAYFPADDWPSTMHSKFAEFDVPARHFLDDLGPDSETLYTAVEEVALPLPWHRGRVLLIGDAAHASTPFMGQGGAMAMQDAVVLAEALERADDLDKALTTFGAARFPVCQFVQDASRAVGEAGARETPEDRTEDRHSAMKSAAQASVDGFYGKLHELIAEGDALLAQA